MTDVVSDDTPNVDPLEVIVQRFVLVPGELVVLTFPGSVTPSQAEAVKQHWDKRFPDNRCIVISGGGRVTGVLADGSGAA